MSLWPHYGDSAWLDFGPGTGTAGESILFGYFHVGDGVKYFLLSHLWRPSAGRSIQFEAIQVDGQEAHFDHIPYEDDSFVWAAGYFLGLNGPTKHQYFLFDVVLVLVSNDPHSDGTLVPVEREKLHPISTAKMVGPTWCPVANVKAEIPFGPGGKEIRRGTKQFVAGAKVYCADVRWGDGYENIVVIGHHRHSHKFITVVMPSARLTNWRLERVFEPFVIERFWPEWDGTDGGRIEAQDIVNGIRAREAAQHHS